MQCNIIRVMEAVNMEPYNFPRYYTILFNGITKAIAALDQQDPGEPAKFSCSASRRPRTHSFLRKSKTEAGRGGCPALRRCVTALALQKAPFSICPAQDMRLRRTPLPLAAAARSAFAVQRRGGYRGRCAATRRGVRVSKGEAFPLRDFSAARSPR